MQWKSFDSEGAAESASAAERQSQSVDEGLLSRQSVSVDGGIISVLKSPSVDSVADRQTKNISFSRDSVAVLDEDENESDEDDEDDDEHDDDDGDEDEEITLRFTESGPLGFTLTQEDDGPIEVQRIRCEVGSPI